MLRRLLERLSHLQTEESFRYRLVVLDNDAERSALSVVETARRTWRIPTLYCNEPKQNIALARNRALECADGDFIAFIDDDEIPGADWLLHLVRALIESGADGVLGPVEPVFEQIPPSWVVRGRFWEIPVPRNVQQLQWNECQTGNVLLRKDILRHVNPAFRPELCAGGEDRDFFRRLFQKGCRFVWCGRAVVYQIIPQSRCRRAFLLKRALLRGRMTAVAEGLQPLSVVKSILACGIYTACLPATLLLPHHYFMQCAVRGCDHLGKLFTHAHIGPRERRYLTG